MPEDIRGCSRTNERKLSVTTPHEDRCRRSGGPRTCRPDSGDFRAGLRPLQPLAGHLDMGNGNRHDRSTEISCQTSFEMAAGRTTGTRFRMGRGTTEPRMGNIVEVLDPHQVRSKQATSRTGGLSSNPWQPSLIMISDDSRAAQRSSGGNRSAVVTTPRNSRTCRSKVNLESVIERALQGSRSQASPATIEASLARQLSASGLLAQHRSSARLS